MEKAELKALLETPLDPKLDYYDATASIEAMAEHIRGLHKLINYMFESLTAQGGAILDIREKMINHREAIEHLADLLNPNAEDSKLVGFDKSPIIMPGKVN